MVEEKKWRKRPSTEESGKQCRWSRIVPVTEFPLDGGERARQGGKRSQSRSGDAPWLLDMARVRVDYGDTPTWRARAE